MSIQKIGANRQGVLEKKRLSQHFSILERQVSHISHDVCSPSLAVHIFQDIAMPRSFSRYAGMHIRAEEVANDDEHYGRRSRGRDHRAGDDEYLSRDGKRIP